MMSSPAQQIAIQARNSVHRRAATDVIARREAASYTDSELMMRVQTDADESSAAELVRRHAGPAWRVAFRMLGNSECAEDLVQEAFLSVFESKRCFNPNRPFSAWFYTVLRNRCSDHLRRRLAERRSLRYVEDSMPASDADGDPADSAEVEEESSRAAAGLARLSATDQEILALRLDGRLPFSEIGQILGVSEGLAKKRTYRALDRLRQGLAP